VGALSVDGQTAPVPKTLVRPDVHLALDVLVDRPTEITLDAVALADPVSKANDLLVGEVTHSRARVDLGSYTGLDGLRRPDPIDVGERSFETLVSRNIDPSDTCHLVGLLALALLVSWVVTNDHDAPTATNDLALVAYLLDARTNLHVAPVAFYL